MMKFFGFGLLDGFSDNREGKRSIAIFSPVGNLGQLADFVAHVKKLGIADKVDFIFIVRPGLKMGRTGLSELRCNEKMPIGTSGCFFAGQALSYALGYETVVVADLDAFLDSRNTFDSMVEMAGKKKCAVVPMSKSRKGGTPGRGYAVPNQWGVFPREVFEAAGFAMPYPLRGGEDYEYAKRLSGKGLLAIFSNGFVLHPRAGFTAYHKMAEAKKFYPYVAGLMRAMLFSSEYSRDTSLLYLAWYLYYSFLSDAFGEGALGLFVRGAHTMKGASSVEWGAPKFRIDNSGGSFNMPSAAAYRAIFIPSSLLLLALFGKIRFGSDDIRMLIPRWKLAVGLVVAALLMPVRLLQGMLSLAAWQETKKKFPFPPGPDNVEEAARAFLSELADQ